MRAEVSLRESPVEYPCISAIPKLRTRTRKNCEHALVELGGIETQKSVQDVRLDR